MSAITRANTLLTGALTQIDKGPAYSAVNEVSHAPTFTPPPHLSPTAHPFLVDRLHSESFPQALSVTGGIDAYLEAHSSGLYVPSTHSVPEAAVNAVWAQLLKTTDETDWNKLFQEGKTQWELHAGMVSHARVERGAARSGGDERRN